MKNSVRDWVILVVGYLGLEFTVNLDLTPLWDIGLEKIHSQHVGCRFFLLTVSFAFQKLCSFMSLYLLIANLRVWASWCKFDFFMLANRIGLVRCLSMWLILGIKRKSFYFFAYYFRSFSIARFDSTDFRPGFNKLASEGSTIMNINYSRKTETEATVYYLNSNYQKYICRQVWYIIYPLWIILQVCFLEHWYILNIKFHYNLMILLP